jgi:hypothetical protein
MEESKAGLYIVAIVGVIAVVAIVIMVVGANAISTTAPVNTKDSVGEASLYDSTTIIAGVQAALYANCLIELKKEFPDIEIEYPGRLQYICDNMAKTGTVVRSNPSFD